ncbi:hypothetical protein [Culicoidibacter larvae]|uniref:Uncharacterized protein n=1 Tax=Culicoidibacter larvae TaxID=2579976 RepID=A0A5R8Q8A6_9FIRM|nr:hypothetical protein [Culicoidibacter larvae]TLG71818.1 hypothetical protein FEZ08_10445 [Culicoidibacter larvae]
MKRLRVCFAVLFCLVFSVSNLILVQAQALPKSEQEAMLEELHRLYSEGKDAGTYSVTIEYEENGQTINKEVRITVTKDDTVIQGNIAINAEPISISPEQVADATDAFWISSANAKAWRTTTLEELPIISVDASQIQNREGQYLLTFTTVDAVATSVAVTVIGNNEIFAVDGESGQASVFHDTYTDNAFDFMSASSWFWLALNTLLAGLIVVPLILLLIHYGITNKIYRQVVSLLKK